MIDFKELTKKYVQSQGKEGEEYKKIYSRQLELI